MAGLPFGYARVSTDDQDMTLQFAALERYGVPEHRIFSEHASGKNMNRKGLKRVLKLMDRGDTLVVWKLDRLGRSLSDLIKMAEKLEKDGVNLVSLTDSINTTTPTGRLFFHFMGAMAEWERAMISERTKAGMAAAKAAGSKFGRLPLIWKGDRGSARRIAYLQGLEDAGQLRHQMDGEWVLLPKAGDVMAELNKAKHRSKADKDITNAETVRRWAREGFDGIKKEPSTDGI